MKVSSIYLVILSFISPFLSLAQSDLRFNHLTADQGLSSSNTNCHLKDHTGYLWIGTNGGLNRFDGKNTRSYTHIIGDSTSLINDKILSIYEDNLFRLWIGTQGGLSILMPGATSFINHYKFDWDTMTVDLTKGVRAIGQI